jgi:hypothetical protein
MVAGYTRGPVSPPPDRVRRVVMLLTRLSRSPGRTATARVDASGGWVYGGRLPEAKFPISSPITVTR